MGQYPSARAAAYADDGFVRDTLLTVLRILGLKARSWGASTPMKMCIQAVLDDTGGWRHGHGGPAHPSKCAFRLILMMQMHFDT